MNENNLDARGMQGDGRGWKWIKLWLRSAAVDLRRNENYKQQYTGPNIKSHSKIYVTVGFNANNAN